MSAGESERYAPLLKIAAGGMATVWIGAARGPLGFSTLVAIKEPHPHLVADQEFRRTFLEEARVASRIRHANVVEVRDVDVHGDVVRLVMPYIEGSSLSGLLTRVREKKSRVPPPIAARIVLDAAAGLAAAHGFVNEAGRTITLVHRDVSPQNILIGVDGVSRITDFGISKATDSANPTTTAGTLKGKVGYMAPEYIERHMLDARADVFAMGVVLWESLAAERLFSGQGDLDTMKSVLSKIVPPISSVTGIDRVFDDVLARALDRNPEARTPSAAALAQDLERAAQTARCLASHAEVSAFLRELFAEDLAARRALLAPKLSPSEASSAFEKDITRAVDTSRGWNTTLPIPTVAVTAPSTPPSTLAMETRRLPSPPVPVPVPVPVPASLPAKRISPFVFVAPALLLVIAGGIAAWRFSQRDESNATTTITPPPAVAVETPTDDETVPPALSAAVPAKNKPVAPQTKTARTAGTGTGTGATNGTDTLLQLSNGDLQIRVDDNGNMIIPATAPADSTPPRRRQRINPSQ